MLYLKDIILTNVLAPQTVHSEKGRHFEMHNRKSFGLSFCLQGEIIYHMNGKTYSSNPGNAVLLPRGGYYNLYGKKEGFFPLLNFQCKGLNCDTVAVLPLQNPQSYIKDFEVLQSLFLFAENRLKIFGTFYELLNKLDKEQQPHHNLLSPVLSYIEAHVAEPELSNTLLAKQVDISEVYLRKLFATQLNTTPKQYILDIRIRKAKQLLADSSLSVTAISDACGFSSLYHFCRIFKEYTGYRPFEYINLVKIQKAKELLKNSDLGISDIAKTVGY